MIYEKNTKQPRLSDELFKNPNSEYRGTPFWAWNCKLEEDELHRQIDVFNEMGLGGFHMHVRTGLENEYLSDEYMGLVKSCVDYAKDKEMLAWLYDEDRWPSGAAGGIVTKDRKYRERYLFFTCNKEYKPTADDSLLLARFDVCLDVNNTLASYKKLEEGESAQGTEWQVWREISRDNPWYNGQAYLDTLNKDAVKKFIEVTHDKYKEWVGDDFGKTVPAIFTDEPQFRRKQTLAFADSKQDVKLPWTDSFAERFEEKYGYSIIEKLPELLWDLPENQVSVARYHYHDFIAELFATAFADQCGEWCEKNGIALTGHMMEEPTLKSQTAALGEAMRSYRGFHIPGIDMLCARFELTTAKQAQSAVHQYGRAGMMSELYGVTGWDFDFRGHKLHGDWQAALGVTVRVPNLSWVSMKGNAKRDYPASISYQSSWYKEYSYIEDHFARVNTAMTRGVPMVRVGVIHPVESYWLHWGPSEQTELIRSAMDENFKSLTSWLLRGSIDFDFISESLLPEQCEKGSAPLQVGKMAYDVVIVPECETLRSTTLDRLEDFRKAGGKLIFMGKAPKYENAVASKRGQKLYEKADSISFNRSALLAALNDFRNVEIRGSNGGYSNRLIHQLRRDEHGVWLFVSPCDEPRNKDIPTSDTYKITLEGKYVPKLYDTQNGEIYDMGYSIKNGKTTVFVKLYEYDTALIFFEDAPDGAPESVAVNTGKTEIVDLKRLDATVPFSLSEPNVYVLDMAYPKLDDGEFEELEEVLRADEKFRTRLGLPDRRQHVIQPWAITDMSCDHTITLKFEVESEITVKDAALALEDADVAEITINGKALKEKKDLGYYTDRCIRVLEIPAIKKGITTITVKLPFGARKDVENCFILGSFGVELKGRSRKIVALPEKLGFDDIVRQGLPHFGGAVTYHLETETDQSGELCIRIPHYRAAVLTIALDGEKKNTVVYPPYEASLGQVEAGKHKVDITAYISRNNSFGTLHHADRAMPYNSPSTWFSHGVNWTYEYRLREEGIITTPQLYIKK